MKSDAIAPPHILGCLQEMGPRPPPMDRRRPSTRPPSLPPRRPAPGPALHTGRPRPDTNPEALSRILTSRVRLGRSSTAPTPPLRPPARGEGRAPPATSSPGEPASGGGRGALHRAPWRRGSSRADGPTFRGSPTRHPSLSRPRAPGAPGAGSGRLLCRQPPWARLNGPPSPGSVPRRTGGP